MGRLFGTDGVRGLANSELTPSLALAVAAAAADVLVGPGVGRATAVVGRDPRISGVMLEAAVVAGLTSAGVDVIRVGVLPTPAVAFLTGEFGADLGIMLSASHNPMPDNGIKIFAAGGHKLSDDTEERIEELLEARSAGTDDTVRPIGAALGTVRDDVDGAERYLAHLLSAVPTRLDGLRVIVDCANGAASTVAPELYRRAGAEVIAIAAEPNGLNINDGVGSTHIGVVAEAVRTLGADLGIAHDGDADRCNAVDADGELIDGDQILALLALELHEAGRLKDSTVVATVMSNIGFHRAMRSAGISVVSAAVGDRYVLEELHQRGLSLGGEQSGHVIFTEAATTGDGLLTALHLMSVLHASGRPLGELAAVVQRSPQVLLNVPVTDRVSAASSETVHAAVAAAEDELGEDGRILLRASGTEQLVRVMVEAPTAEQAEAVAQRVAAVVAAG